MLGGCGLPAPQDPGPTDGKARHYQQRLERLQVVAGWTLTGRAVVSGGGSESGQARIRWRHSAGEDRLQASSPLGRTLLEIHQAPDRLQVRDKTGRRYTGAAARRQIQRRLGWRVPLERLADWAVGRTGDGTVPAGVDAKGRARRMKQGGWQVTYGEYGRVGDLWLPRAFRVERGGVRLRVRVDNWQIDRSGSPAAKGGGA